MAVYCAAATTCNTGGAQPTFSLLAEGSGTSADGDYAYLEGKLLISSLLPVRFLHSTMHVILSPQTVSKSELSSCHNGKDGDWFFKFYAPSDASHYSYTTAACNIVDGELACSGGGYSILNLCQQSLILSLGSTIASDCYPVTLVPQYFC